MSKSVYLVTAGSYSDYHIIRAFLDKNKAESYMKVCDEPDLNELEEYELSDDKIFTPVYYIDVDYYIGKIPSYINDKYNFEIIKSNSLDTDINNMNFTWYDDHGTYQSISMYRPIHSKNFNEDKLKKKYRKICEDLETQIKSLKEIEGWNEKMIREWLKNKQNIIPESE